MKLSETIVGMPTLQKSTAPAEKEKPEREEAFADVNQTIAEEVIDVVPRRAGDGLVSDEIHVGPTQGTVVLSKENVQDALAKTPSGAPEKAMNRTVVMTDPGFVRLQQTSSSAPAPSLDAPKVPSVPPARVPAARAPSKRSRPTNKLWIGLCASAFLASAVVGAAIVKVFSYADTHWVAPTVLSQNDPRVLQVAATLQQETVRRGELSLRRKDLEGRLDEAEHSVTLEEGFQASYLAALNADLQNEREELRRTTALLATEESKVEAAGAASEKEADYRTNLANVRRRIQVLESARKSVAKRADLPRYGALSLQREYNASLVATSKGRELTTALRKAIAETDALLKEKDELIASIRQSPYGVAIGSDATIGFIPYENMNAIKTGDPLFACSAGLLLCTQVGTVGNPLPGEAKGVHPNGGRTLRGQMVRVDFQDPHAEERPVLYAGKKPLL